MAFRIPLVLPPLPFKKKVTVIGIIGNTQGVNKATKPERNATIKKSNKLSLSSPVSPANVLTQYHQVPADIVAV